MQELLIAVARGLVEDIPLHELNIFINQFEQMCKMMKGFSDVKKVIGGNPNKAKLTAHQMMKNMRRFR